MNTGKYKSPYDGGATGEAKQMNKIVFSFSNILVYINSNPQVFPTCILLSLILSIC